jgi:thioredoxin-like negative regulator of GroEL
MKQVIRFTANWCSPCKIYAPTFEKVASEISGVRFETIDVDSTDSRIIDMGIRGVPTTVVLENGQVVKKQSGNMSEVQLKQFIS